MDQQKIILAAKKSFIAQANPYNSVVRVFPQIIESFYHYDSIFYMGVKNRAQIPRSFVQQLETTNRYRLHTIDEASQGGRAIDLLRRNPITGRPMTGSSSGTAINVLIGMNDLGIGTDGGGSVLAPAMSLNLYGFISPLLRSEPILSISRSTDGISFTPSLGFISRDIQTLKEATSIFLKLTKPSSYTVQEQIPSELDLLGPREPLIDYLSQALQEVDVVVSEEGPVDLHGFGDSIFGHMGEQAQTIQRASHKGFIRVATMANATALVVPKNEYGSGTVLLCESTLPKIAALFAHAETLVTFQDPLLERYFRSLDTYFPNEY